MLPYNTIVELSIDVCFLTTSPRSEPWLSLDSRAAHTHTGVVQDFEVQVGRPRWLCCRFSAVYAMIASYRVGSLEAILSRLCDLGGFPRHIRTHLCIVLLTNIVPESARTDSAVLWVRRISPIKSLSSSFITSNLVSTRSFPSSTFFIGSSHSS